MIPNQYYVVLDSNQVKGKPIGVTRMGGRLVFWRDKDGQVHFNRLIAHQDRRVVQTQVPKPSGLSIGEKLIQGDRPIVEYRRRRQHLIEAADKAASAEITHA